MKRLIMVVACLAIGLVGLGAVAAAGAPPSGKKVAVCHWAGKKYVKITVGASAFATHLGHGKDVAGAQACPTQPTTGVKSGGRLLKTSLTGGAEVPGPGDPDGSGTATIRLDQRQGKICFTVKVSAITLPAAAAHIHVGGSTVAGPVVVGLTAPDASGVSFGCVNASAELISAIRANPSNYYVNVHTSDYPAGAVRGQL